MDHFLKFGQGHPILRAAILTFSLLILLVACSAPAPESVEVTRIVTESESEVVDEEGVTVEVTRVVTETVVEPIITEEYEAADEEPPSATGSEDDAGPLPPAPDNGPKVSAREGVTSAEENILETAVVLRANQDDSAATDQPSRILFVNTADPILWQKLCQFAQKTYKKRCI